MDLLYRMPTSLHCSHKRSHSPSSSLPRQIFKKKKRAHDLPYSAFPEHSQQPPTPTGHDGSTVAHDSNIPIMIPKQTHNSSSSSSKNEVIRINDMDAFLAGAGGDDNDLAELAAADCTLLHGDKNRYLVDVKLKDGSSIPMERRAGETRLRIPDFVLNGNTTKTTASTNDSDDGSNSSRALIRYHPPLRPGASSEGTRQHEEENEHGEDRMMELDNSSNSYYNDHPLPQPYYNNSFSSSSNGGGGGQEDVDDDTIMAMEID